MGPHVPRFTPSRFTPSHLTLLPRSGLDEYLDGFRTNAVELHCISRLSGLHHLLEGVHVGDVDDQADTVGLRWVDERPSRDAQRPEELFSFG